MVSEPEPEPVVVEDRVGLGPWILVGALTIVLVAVIAGVLVVQVRRNQEARDAAQARQDEVARRGTQVMPFDQNLTSHAFAPTDAGGTETVTANDPADTTQIALVQGHLRQEQALFAAGNFSDPAAIHGHDMPGLADLQAAAGAGQLTVTFAALPTGARLTYAATTPAAIAAVHAFFDAQVADHGVHATTG